MKKYKQLNYEERIAIRYGLFKKMSIREISRMLRRSPSTISREIKRGITLNGTYFAESTEREIRQRKMNDKRKRIMDNPVIYSYVACRLKNKQSPAIIQRDIERDTGFKIGKDAIYEYIYRFKYDEWFKLLTRKKKYNYKKSKGKKKVIIKNKINISERPKEANQRLEFGHFEADTIFSCSGSKSALLVIVDRLTRKTHIKKLERKTASLTSSSIVVALSEYNILHIHSITYDNGCDFAGHEFVNTELNTVSFFCKPYHAWEKGTVENINS